MIVFCSTWELRACCSLRRGGWGTDNCVEVVANAEWCALHPHMQWFIIQMWSLASGHFAIFVDLEKPSVRQRRHKFMFENAWLVDSGCKDVVKHRWEVAFDRAILATLELCTTKLKRWGW